MNVLIINAFSSENENDAISNFSNSQITTTNNCNTINTHNNTNSNNNNLNQYNSKFSKKSKNQKKFNIFEKLIKDMLNKATSKSSTGRVNFDTRIASQSDLAYYISDQDDLQAQHAKKINIPNNRNFDKLDLIFIDGNEKFLPWCDHGVALRTLIKMAIINNKHIFACGVAMQSLIYFLAINFAHDMNFINSNGEVQTIEDIDKIPKSFLQNLKKYDYFLDYVTGDVYEYHTRSLCWTPNMNIGLHKLNLTEKYNFRGKFVLNPQNKQINNNTISNSVNNISISKTERPIFSSNNNEIKVQIYKSFLNHWIIKNIPHEFLVNCSSTWLMHTFHLKSKLIQFKILANSPKGPMIVEYGNCIGLSFHIIDKPKYSETIKILENFIFHKTEELEKGGFAIDKMIKDIEEQRYKEKFNCRSDFRNIDEDNNCSNSQSQFSKNSKLKNVENLNIDLLRKSVNSNTNRNSVEFVDKKLAEEFLIRYKKEIDSGIDYRKEISQKYKIKDDYYTNMNLDLNKDKKECDTICKEENEKLNINTNYQTTSVKNNIIKSNYRTSSHNLMPHIKKREIKIVENNAINSRPVSSRPENKILPMNKPGSAYKPTNSFAFYLKSQGTKKDDKFIYDEEVIDTGPNYLETTGDPGNLNKLSDVLALSSDKNCPTGNKNNFEKKSKISTRRNSNSNSPSNDKKEEFKADKADNYNWNVFSIMFPYVSEEEFPKRIKRHIVGSGFEELRKGKDVIRVDLTKKTISNYNKTFKKYEKDLNTFALKPSVRCSSAYLTEDERKRKEFLESKTKWTTKEDFKKTFGKHSTNLKPIPSIIATGSPPNYSYLPKFREIDKSKWVNHRNFKV